MISLLINVVFAEETQEVEGEQTQETQAVEEANIVTAKAKVIETGEITKRTTGSIEDTVQQIKIEIIDGEYEAKEFTTEFVLSYDIEGKILAYELREGDTVSVQLAVDANGNITPTVEGIIRSNYIYINFNFSTKHYFSRWKKRNKSNNRSSYYYFSSMVYSNKINICRL